MVFIRVKPVWSGGSGVDEQVQLIPKLIPKTIVDAIIIAQNFRNILLNIRVENDLHFRRSC